jgi:hypothetical protein
MLANLNADPKLFHTVDGTAFADLTIYGHGETWPVRGTRFRSVQRTIQNGKACDLAAHEGAGVIAPVGVGFLREKPDRQGRLRRPASWGWRTTIGSNASWSSCSGPGNGTRRDSEWR